MSEKFNPFSFVASLVIYIGLGSHFWNAWYVPVATLVFIIFLIFVIPEDKYVYIVARPLNVLVAAIAVWGFYQFPTADVETRTVLGNTSAAFLTITLFGHIIADYFNQKGMFNS